MTSIFLLQWQRFLRDPFAALAMVLLTVVLVFFIAGMGGEQQMTVQTYADDALSGDERDNWLELLNESDVFSFTLVEEEEARDAVSAGNASTALRLMEDDYRILAMADDPDQTILDQYVHQVFSEELRVREMEEAASDSGFRETVQESLASPVLELTAESIRGGDGSFADAERLRVLFGMTLFFSIYTIMFGLTNIAEEKRAGTWDRLILSPLKKWQMYIGQLLYCFSLGYTQIFILFLFFQYVLNFDLGDNFAAIAIIIACYVFVIVALGVLIIGLIRTPAQLQVVIPLVATSIAMLGGAFWPLEVVTNDWLLALSNVIPMTYAMESLNSVVLYDRGLADVGTQLSILILSGVVCMGIGANLMERR